MAAQPMAAYEYILSAVDGPVGIVTLNRPKQLIADRSFRKW